MAKKIEIANLPALGAYATTKQFCHLYQVSRTTWWRLSNTEGFPAAIRFGRSVLWSTEEVRAYMERKD